MTDFGHLHDLWLSVSARAHELESSEDAEHPIHLCLICRTGVSIHGIDQQGCKLTPTCGLYIQQASHKPRISLTGVHPATGYSLSTSYPHGQSPVHGIVGALPLVARGHSCHAAFLLISAYDIWFSASAVPRKHLDRFWLP